MNEAIDVLTFIALLGAGLVAGIFFAFSTFIMRALDRVGTVGGIQAMQAINVTVLNPWFFGAFFGTAAVCIVVVILALLEASGLRQAYLLTGSALYLLGCIAVTIVFNVPLNDRLAASNAETAEASELWAHYRSRWTLWNHVRTAASFAAAGLLALSFAAA